MKIGYLGLGMLIIGILFMFDSGVNVTGAAIGASAGPFALFAFGMVLALSGALVLAAKYRLEDIMAGHTSNKFKKSAEYLGKKHFEHGMGSLPGKCPTPKETYRELFDVLQLERRRGEHSPEAEDFQKRYNRHRLAGGIPELGLKEAITYDAKTLSTGHRGAYRYVFDRKGKYIGLAAHKTSQGKYKYKWE